MADWDVPGGIVDFECPYGAEWGGGPPRGLGEVIAAVTKRLGIRECGGCRKRRRRLNRLWMAGIRLALAARSGFGGRPGTPAVRGAESRSAGRPWAAGQ